MRTDALEMSLLFDYYGELLTEKQRVCFDLYHNQDLSLAEIAESEGISRQGVHDSITRAETALRSFEQALGCVRRERLVQKALAEITAAAQALQGSSDHTVQQLSGRILSAADTLKE
jgi:predicted DNA-binding protein YlxM (UPF0122 family)